jgi:excisionase family DNA binding protein
MDESDSRTPSAATLSVPEAGRLLGLGRNASYDAARRGELPVLKFGRKKRVPCVALQRMLVEARPRSSANPEEA